MSQSPNAMDDPAAPEAEPKSGTFGVWGWGLSLIAAGLIVAYAWLAWTPSAWLVDEMMTALDEAPDGEVVTRIRQIAELGDAGIEPLVESLASSREIVAESAQRQLAGELDRWELLPSAESTAKIARLVKALQSKVPKWPAAPLKVAAEFAHRALRWRLDSRSREAMEIVAGCEAVLKASAIANRPAAAPVSLAAFHDDATGGNPREAAWNGGDSTGALQSAAFDQNGPPPSADLPLDLFPLPAPPPWPNTENASAAKGATPPEQAPSAPGEPALLAPLPGRPVPLEPAPSDAIANRPRATAPSAEFMKHLATMKNLRSLDAAVAAAAEAELRAAGFDDLRLEIARRIGDPDPAVRRALVDQLPRVAGLDARPWLLALLEDADPSVVAATRQVLSTSSDPALQGAARESMRR